MRLIILIMVVLLAGCATGYGRMGLRGGFSDRQIAEDTWEVTFRTNGPAGPGYAIKGAMYRSAELANAAGFPYFQVVRVKGTATMVGAGYGPPSTFAGETVNLKVRGTHDPRAQLTCENEDGRGCGTMTTERILRELEAEVRKTPAQPDTGSTSADSV